MSTRRGIPMMSSSQEGWRFVQNEPVQAQRAHGLGKLRESNRCEDVAVAAQPVPVADVVFLLRRGQDDHRQQTRALVGAHPAKHFQTIDLGELQVQQDERRRHPGITSGKGAGAEQIIQRLGAVTNQHHLVEDVPLLQSADRQVGVVGVVFHEQNDLVLHETSLSNVVSGCYFFVRSTRYRVLSVCRERRLSGQSLNVAFCGEWLVLCTLYSVLGTPCRSRSQREEKRC